MFLWEVFQKMHTCCYAPAVDRSMSNYVRNVIKCIIVTMFLSICISCFLLPNTYGKIFIGKVKPPFGANRPTLQELINCMWLL